MIILKTFLIVALKLVLIALYSIAVTLISGLLWVLLIGWVETKLDEHRDKLRAMRDSVHPQTAAA